MNKIYKTIHNALTGKTAVASELAKNRGKRQACSSINHCQNSHFCHSFLATWISKAVSIVLLTALGSHALAQQRVYDGTGTVASGIAVLEQAGSIQGGLPRWMGLASGDQGVIYRDGTDSNVTTDADLVINYPSGTAPRFVIGGYSDTGNKVSGNKVTLQQGTVNGSVYGGLSYVSQEKNAVTGTLSGNKTSANASANQQNSSANASNNDVIVNANNVPSIVTGNLYGGHAKVLAHAGNATAGGNATGSTAFAYADAYAHADYSTAEANSNTVTIGGNTSVTGDLYSGYASIVVQAGNASAADANSNAGAALAYASAYVVGDESKLVANSNTTTIGNSISITGSVYGGYASFVAQGANAQAGNATTPFDSATASAAAGASGYLSTVTAIKNTVAIGDNSSITGSVYGGYASLVVRAGNAVAGNATAGGGTNSTSSAGVNVDAYKSIITADSNKVTIGGSASVAGNLFGGSANISARGGSGVAGNLNAISGYVSSLAYASVSGSTVTADNNTITVGDGSSITGNLCGGYADILAQAGSAVAGDAAGTGANTNDIAHAYARAYTFASDSIVRANGNTVTIGENASVAGNLYGGYANIFAQGGSAQSGTATSATPNVDAMAYAFVVVSRSTVMASNNTITVGKSTVIDGSIRGGYVGLRVQAGNAIGGYANGALANANARLEAENVKIFVSANHITLGGTLQNGSIYGGHIVFNITPGTAILADGVTQGDASVILTGSQVQAIDNVVTFSDTAHINGTTTSLYGGYLQYKVGLAPESYDVFTGNTLNWSAKAPATVQTVANFEHYNFSLNPAYANTGTALITAQDVVFGANSSNISTGATTFSKISVLGIHSGKVLNAGDEFILMQANSMAGDGVGLTTTGVAQQGISLLYHVRTDVDINGKKVTAIILGPSSDENGNQGGGNAGGGNNGGNGGSAARVNPQLKALSEGYLAGAQLVMRGADLIADDAFSAINEQNNQNGWVPFAVLSGQHNRYNSGSHIKSNDFLLTGGLSYQQDRLTAGALVEAGWGSYDTYNSFYNAVNVKGDGHDRYYGVGLLGRYDFESGLYTEASLRFGQNHNKFNTHDIVNFTTGQFANYSVTSSYVSAHIGAGYILPINEKNELDLSVKYLYSTLGGKDVNIAGDNIHFERINSHRARLNATLNHQYSPSLILNAGLGYEHEFAGKARATTYGVYSIDAPSVRGGTGIVTIGANIKPTSNQRLTLDIKANAYGGKREGVGASIRVNYAF